VGGGVDGRFSAWYQIVDSTYYVNGVGDPVNANRDQFGFSLRTSAGVDLFTFYLTPYTQTVFPVIPENAPSTDTYSWSSAYANGGSPTVVVPTLASEYGKAYLFEVDFSPIAGTNDVLFSATNQGVDLFTGVLNNASNQVIGQVGAIWNPTYGAANAGTNVLVFDNVSLVPEPSSALLGLLGASFVFVRRRRA